MFATSGLLLAGSSPARADRAEASIHAHLVGGVALASDPATTDTATAALGGVAVRASYARSNLFQYDAQLTLASTGGAAFEGGAFEFNGEPATHVPFHVTTRVVRLDAGATFRFGVRVIPTVRLAVGVEQRFRGAAAATIGSSELQPDGRGSEMVTDLVGVGAVGLDYRFGPRLIAGASIGGSLAFVGDPAWKTLEGSAHLAYYFYPLWFD